MPLEAWLLNVAPGKQEGQLVDPNRWTIARSMWSRTLRELIARLEKFERLLYLLSTPKFSELKIMVTVKAETVVGSEENNKGTAKRRAPKKEERSFFLQSVREFFGIDSNAETWDSFFVEWVARPFSNRLRKSFEKIDDRLRVLDPNILPTWDTLYELFTEIGTCEEGVNLLPSKVEYAYRLDDEKAPSAKLITLWRQLRKIARRERISSVSVREGYVARPMARRRRRGG
jgi:hypothetical protein